jgi:hypothetical protein
MSRSALDPSLPVETATEPVNAWRAWALTGRRDGSHLLLRPVVGRGRPWLPRRPAEAGCRMLGPFHEAPDPGCSCGLHGTHGLDLLRRTRCPAVLGRVALWGRVIEHELGFRARYGYPQRLRLICQFCFWQRGIHGVQPTVVGWFSGGELLPMCEDHVEMAGRYGMRPQVSLPAREIDQRLRDTYAVDLLVI